MEQEQKKEDIRNADFTITRTDQMFWFNIKRPDQEDYVLELNSDEALDLAEIFDAVIRSEDCSEEEDNLPDA
jgi:hypothetical protein